MAKLSNMSYAWYLGYNQYKNSDCPSSLINPFERDIEEDYFYDWLDGYDEALNEMEIYYGLH